MKIFESIEILRKLRLKGSNLKIFVHDYYNPHSIYMCQKYVIVTPYCTSSGKRDDLLYRYSYTDDRYYFRRLRDDIFQLVKYESKQFSI